MKFALLAIFFSATPVLQSADAPSMIFTVVPNFPEFRSWADYRQDVFFDAQIHDSGNFASASLEIRRKQDNALVARFNRDPQLLLTQAKPSFKPARLNLSAIGRQFSDEDLREIGPPVAGDYLVALNLNGQRASNVISVRIEPDFDPLKAPVLQLGVLEYTSLHQLLVAWLRGPSPRPDDLEFSEFRFLTLVADGRERNLKGYSPGAEYQMETDHAILPGQFYSLLIEPDNYLPTIEKANAHVFSVKFHESGLPPFESPPISVRLGEDSLGQAWDLAKPLALPRPANATSASPPGAVAAILPAAPSPAGAPGPGAEDDKPTSVRPDSSTTAIEVFRNLSIPADRAALPAIVIPNLVINQTPLDKVALILNQIANEYGGDIKISVGGFANGYGGHYPVVSAEFKGCTVEAIIQTLCARLVLKYQVTDNQVVILPQ